MGNLAPDAVQLHPGKHNKEGRGGCSPYLFSVFRHFFLQPHANKFRKLTLHLYFCLFLSEILGICYASCVCSACTYVYLFNFVADPNARTVRSLSLPHLLSFFFLLVLCCLWTTTL